MTQPKDIQHFGGDEFPHMESLEAKRMKDTQKHCKASELGGSCTVREDEMKKIHCPWHGPMYGYCSDCVRGEPTAIPEQEAKSGWIDVNQELPPRSRVLVYFPTESTSVMDGLFDGKDFHVDGFVRTKAVTHWQSLPAPPEVKR